MAETDNTTAAGHDTNDLDEHINPDESSEQAPPSRPPQTEEEVEACVKRVYTVVSRSLFLEMLTRSR